MLLEEHFEGSLKVGTSPGYVPKNDNLIENILKNDKCMTIKHLTVAGRDACIEINAQTLALCYVGMYIWIWLESPAMAGRDACIVHT